MNKVDMITALNTLAHYTQASAAGLYFNSPDRHYFDGSAEGFWERIARDYGATESEIQEAKQQPVRLTQKSAGLLEACKAWIAYFQKDIPITASACEQQGEEFTAAWFKTTKAIADAECAQPNVPEERSAK